jgi:hypothetical protein
MPALIFLFRFFIKKKMKARPAGQRLNEAEKILKRESSASSNSGLTAFHN